MVWECQACSYVYSAAKGDESSGVEPGIPFKDLPHGWKCPVCGVGKEFFEELHGASD